MPIEIVTITQSKKVIYGVWGESNDKTIAKDIPALSRKYYDVVGESSGSVLPFYVLSKDYYEASGRFALFIGGEIEHSQLEQYNLPEGIYGRIAVKPKLGFIWGMAVGEVKQYFYTKWLPYSEYESLNIEYELHTEKSVTRKPEIDLLFAIKRK